MKGADATTVLDSRRRFAELEPLHADPVRNNPPKLIGYVHRATCTLFTERRTASQPSVPMILRAPNGPHRINRSHAARIRAAERIGVVMRIDEQ